MTTATTITNPAGDRFVGVLDVSGWQMNYAGNGKLRPGAQSPRLELAAELGVAGIIARIGNGSSLDESFAHFWRSARAAGLPIGAYYYAQPNRQSANEAAELVVRWLEPYATELPIMLDLEEYHGADLSPAALGRWVHTFLGRLEQLDRRPIVYAGAAFVNDRSITPTLAGYDTIQPRYARNNQRPPVPLEQWAAWIRWDREPRYTDALGAWEGYQFTSSGHGPAYGMPADAATDRLDLNVVHVDAWARWNQQTNRPAWRSPMSSLHMLEKAQRVADTRKPVPAPVVVGEEFTLPVTAPAGIDPRAAVLTITLVNATGGVHLSIDDALGTSANNTGPDAPPAANTTLANVRTIAGRKVVKGRIAGQPGAAVHIVADLIAVIS